MVSSDPVEPTGLNECVPHQSKDNDDFADSNSLKGC